MPAEDALHWPLVTVYLDAAADGRFAVPVCGACGESYFPPRTLCPYCLADDVSLRESSGEGVVYAATVVHVDYHPYWGDRTPYVNALVDLDDGPVVFANVVDCDPGDVAPGRAVSVAFESVEGVTMPVFTLADGE